MWFTSADFQSFWHAPWSLPLRRACAGISQQARTLADPNQSIPPWLTPLIQRWIAQAIATRAAWQQRGTEAPIYRFGRRSEPCWSQGSTLRYDWRCLRGLEEGILLWLLGMELERLYRISQTAPEEVGQELWTETALGVCAHLEQVYRELKRRCKARQAREMLRDALSRFVAWRANEAA